MRIIAPLHVHWRHTAKAAHELAARDDLAVSGVSYQVGRGADISLLLTLSFVGATDKRDFRKPDREILAGGRSASGVTSDPRQVPMIWPRWQLCSLTSSIPFLRPCTVEIALVGA